MATTKTTASDKKTLLDIRMLRKAAKKYEGLADKNDDASIATAPIYANNCELCGHYIHKGCEGCPIFAKTKQTQCGGTSHSTLDKIAGKVEDAHPKAASAALRASWKTTCRRFSVYLSALADELQKTLDDNKKPSKPSEKKIVDRKPPTMRQARELATDSTRGILCLPVQSVNITGGKPSAFEAGTVFSYAPKPGYMSTITMVKTGPLSVLFFNAATQSSAERHYPSAKDMDLSLGSCLAFSAILINV